MILLNIKDKMLIVVIFNIIVNFDCFFFLFVICLLFFGWMLNCFEVKFKCFVLFVFVFIIVVIFCKNGIFFRVDSILL